MSNKKDEILIIVKRTTAKKINSLKKINKSRQNRIDTYDDVINRFIK